jgi:hypothetical protein
LVNKLYALAISVLDDHPQKVWSSLRLFETHVDVGPRSARDGDGVRHRCRPVVAHVVPEVGAPHA